MSTETENQAQPEAAEGSLSFLDRAIEATTQTPADTTKELFSVLTEQALSGTVTWDKNVTKTIENAISEIDKKLSKQLSEVMQQKDLQKLEGSWRGLQKLVKESELGRDLKIKMVDFTQEELLDQFEDAPAIDRSPLFNAVYQGEFGTAGGEPYGTFIGDYEFSAKDEDVALLRYMGEVAAACHAPFVAAANAEMFEFNDFQTFSEGKPVAAGFDSPAYAAWNSFRESDDARYVTLTLPRTLARLPYGGKGLSTDVFAYEELDTDMDGNPKPKSNDQLVWSNAAYDLGLKMTQAYTASGWCTSIRGLDNGGKVENLPNLTYKSEAGDLLQQCPTEVNLTDEREKELSDLGFLPLVHYKSSNYAVFIGGQTTQKPKTFTDPDATANAAISARLPYIMASSRIAHYLKVMGRDKLGSNLEAPDIKRELQLWIDQYTNAGAIGNEQRAKTPLCESRIEVVEQPGKPGAYSAVAHLRPWLQLEELTTSVRMVAKIPG
ncbi:type VI secretion system contractile sheath large subunit [Vibrio gigantis]|jgi:type VI secretion system protein ImpC|uniref:Type VI secretion system contractile sheath large subunit n=3 Tax=Vibrio TaxID=662 RepID=A0A7Y4DSV2_9VIBR|nr:MULTISPECIES: type VI secretion system contractile sheath large subunit [Vibrio]KAA8672396.1 type VI secretion system contractile sheath large subunit [Vibrio gigantis]MCG9560998.1 type VI secretion system contractile sheath large subunit [Vibrio chagasii]MCG9567713.1 type VI secretion system contractile sheath large subunit [Vibrio chagasii]MCG9693540.1 type VI secretion system contractile sheath large subunit [Vibrio sp. Isolate22]MCY9825371.1 type VI secretion system contractile sheath l|eukprot:TRINITY_DN3260_c0_g3_i1.p3 TRINITY_DN3260_c0_g3~~TRINITY_DN3260_c0_g3_i1.p3  ORF type:complete len:493 (-),score=42.34 TRINITY_DN3260_c0_g3_i1:2922-4400(-)